MAYYSLLFRLIFNLKILNITRDHVPLFDLILLQCELHSSCDSIEATNKKIIIIRSFKGKIDTHCVCARVCMCGCECVEMSKYSYFFFSCLARLSVDLLLDFIHIGFAKCDLSQFVPTPTPRHNYTAVRTHINTATHAHNVYSEQQTLWKPTVWTVVLVANAFDVYGSFSMVYENFRFSFSDWILLIYAYLHFLFK